MAMSYELKCKAYGCKSLILLKEVEAGEYIRFACTYGHNSIGMRLKCPFCINSPFASVEGTTHSCLDLRLSEDIRCGNCSRVYNGQEYKKAALKAYRVTSTDVENKPKKISMITLFKSLYLNQYPKLEFAPGALCNKCNEETVFLEFTKEEVKKHCSLCGELEWKL